MDSETDVTSYFVTENGEDPISKDDITMWVTMYTYGPLHSSQQQLEVLYVINPYPTAFPYGNGMVLH